MKLLDGLARCGQVLWHGAALPFDGGAYLAADLMVRAVGGTFPLNPFAPQLFLPLGGAEEVGSKLG
jgi:hypothetical protein